MEPSTSKDFQRGEKPKGNNNKDHNNSKSDSKEKAKRREAWQREQKFLRDHERLKAKKILEYEQRRAAQLGLPIPREKYAKRSSVRRRSRSLECQRRKSPTMETRLEQSSETNAPIFQGPVGGKITPEGLHSVQIKILRDIRERSFSEQGEKSRSIFERGGILRTSRKSEEIDSRREFCAIHNDECGEGSRSIFDRDRSSEEVEEVRVVRMATDEELAAEGLLEKDNSDEIWERRIISKVSDDELEESHQRRSSSSSPPRRRRRSPRRRRSSSHSRSSNDERDHREYRERAREYYLGNNFTGVQGRPFGPHFVQEVPIPIFYEVPHEFADLSMQPILPPGVIMPDPMFQFRGQVPRMRGRGRPRLFRGVHMRPFLPRFIPPNF